jgi:hypothetical protein
MKYNKLLNTILTAQSVAIHSGIKPSEVWLGPKEVDALEKGMDWRNSENAFFLGLTVRHMKSDGVRVGDSVRA